MKKVLTIILAIIASFLIIIGGLWVYLSTPVDRKDDKVIRVEIPQGTSIKGVATTLENKKLIRNKYLFLIEMKVYNKNESIKAATYKLKKSMSLKEIVYSLINSKDTESNDLKITFKEGQTINDYAELIEGNTNNKKEDFINLNKDKEYIKTLIDKYWFLTDDILDENIYYPLEGYLAPNTYNFKNKDVSVKEILETLLDQEAKELEKDKEKLQTKTHYYMTMASIIELEGTNITNRSVIAGIFENRLKKNMNLGSDVTTYYAFNIPITEPLDGSLFEKDNPYNTRAVSMMGKMPIGPICNPSKTSISAALNPTQSNYLYFVADKNKKIYYTENIEEHEKIIAELKEKGDWLW